MTQQHFALLTCVICLLTVNVFAQKNTNTQPQVKQIESQPQSTVIMHTTKKEVTPVYQRVTKLETNVESEKSAKSKATIQPRFSSVARPNIYKNLDTNIKALKQKITNLKADPNHNEDTLIKFRATLKRLQEIEAEKPEGY